MRTYLEAAQWFAAEYLIPAGFTDWDAVRAEGCVRRSQVRGSPAAPITPPGKPGRVTVLSRDQAEAEASW
jgi:hypothetical protein